MKAKVKIKVVNVKNSNTGKNTGTQTLKPQPASASPTAESQKSVQTVSPVVDTPAPTVQKPSSVDIKPVFDPDYSELVGRSDLTYNGLITFSPYGMPVANGRFGGPVWEESKSVLSMQLNHTDTFMYNDASANSTDESGGLGQILIDFGGNVLGDKTFQRLSLYDGRLGIESADVGINVIADQELNAVYINVDDRRDAPKEISIDLKMLRNPVVKKNLFSAVSEFGQNEAENIMSLTQVFSETCDTGIASNDYYCATALAVNVQGREGKLSSPANRRIRMTLPAKKGSFTIVVGGASAMNPGTDVYGKAFDAAKAGKTYDSVYEAGAAWWKDFWKKSYVYLPKQPDYEKRRTYYMYLAGISNRGKYPSKYNGGIWIAQGDRRDWGNYYWNWNQDSLYQPLDSANHMELMEPLFQFRESCYEQYKMAAKQIWGIDGGGALFIGEASGVLGHETLPDNIASDLYAYYAGWGKLTPELEKFGLKRNQFLVPWNWGVFGSRNSVSYVSHTMAATQETAEYYWQKYCYTHDRTWLREHAYKFIKGAAEMYRNYDGFVLEEDGYYHFNRTNLHEHIWGGRDIIDDLSLARGIFAAAVKASEILDTDGELRKKWKDCLEHIAPYPLCSDSDAIYYSKTHNSGNVTWAQGRQPSALVRALEGTESPQFKMLEKFDVLNMETRDQGLDNGDWKIAVDTFYDSPGYRNQYLEGKEDKNGSSRFLEDAAKLGRAEELKVMFASQYKAFENNPNLLNDQGDYYSAEGYGTWSSAIQQALNQSLAPLPGEDAVIRVFPAWPKEWDAKYKLLAKDGFLVSSSIENGEIQYVEIESQLGGTCRIRNPWDVNVVLYRNGARAENIQGGENDLISFETETGEDIVLVREGTDPEQYRSSEV